MRTWLENSTDRKWSCTTTETSSPLFATTMTHIHTTKPVQRWNPCTSYLSIRSSVCERERERERVNELYRPTPQTTNQQASNRVPNETTREPVYAKRLTNSTNNNGITRQLNNKEQQPKHPYQNNSRDRLSDSLALGPLLFYTTSPRPNHSRRGNVRTFVTTKGTGLETRGVSKSRKEKDHSTISTLIPKRTPGLWNSHSSQYHVVVVLCMETSSGILVSLFGICGWKSCTASAFSNQ